MRGQLYQIFDVLGVPGKRAWQSLKPSPELAVEVQQRRARQWRVGHRNRLRDPVPGGGSFQGRIRGAERAPDM